MNGGHPVAAKVQVSNVQVCWELAPPTVAKQQMVAIEDATISSGQAAMLVRALEECRLVRHCPVEQRALRSMGRVFAGWPTRQPRW